MSSTGAGVDPDFTQTHPQASEGVMWRQVWAMTQKEIIQVLRGPAILIILLIMPLAQLGSSQRRLTPISSTTPLTLSVRNLYNPDMIDIWFLLPGPAGLILQTLAVQQAALIIVRERELGTIEPILATPKRPLELVAARNFKQRLD
jgi:hypothetical protein